MNNLRDEDFSPKVNTEDNAFESQNDNNAQSGVEKNANSNQNDDLNNNQNNTQSFDDNSANSGNVQSDNVPNEGGSTSQTVSSGASNAKVRFTPSNLPPSSANTSTGALNKEELEYLGKISDQNYFIKKRNKKIKAKLFEDARPLSRVRRLYALTFSTRYYAFPPREVKKMRDRMGDDKSKIFGAAARRAKNLILSIVMIVAILATLGTGAVVAILAINSSGNGSINYDANQFTVWIVTNDDSSSTEINNYALGMWQGNGENPYIKMKNNMGGPIQDVTFYITLSDIKDKNGNSLKIVGDDKDIDPTKLTFDYSFDKTVWEMKEGQSVTIVNGIVCGPQLTYKANKGIIESSATEIEIIKEFSIDITSFEESNKWANLSMTISFVVGANKVENTTNNTNNES